MPFLNIIILRMALDPLNVRTCILIALIIAAAIYYFQYCRKDEEDDDNEKVGIPKVKENEEQSVDIDSIIANIMRKQIA